jgi:hypothetical protein
MNTHPTIVHAAADFRRQALLREAVDDELTKPTGMRTTGTGPCKACRRAIAWLARVVSRILDDFEPRPGPRPLRSLRRT